MKHFKAEKKKGYWCVMAGEVEFVSPIKQGRDQGKKIAHNIAELLNDPTVLNHGMRAIEALREELKEIRQFLRAHEDESTYDEVVRRMSILEKNIQDLVSQREKVRQLINGNFDDTIYDSVFAYIQKLHKECKASNDDVLKWEYSMMQAIGEDGIGSVTIAIEKLKEEISFHRECGSINAVKHFDKHKAEMQDAALIMSELLKHATNIINPNHPTYGLAYKFILKHKKWDK